MTFFSCRTMLFRIKDYYHTLFVFFLYKKCLRFKLLNSEPRIRIISEKVSKNHRVKRSFLTSTSDWVLDLITVIRCLMNFLKTWFVLLKFIITVKSVWETQKPICLNTLDFFQETHQKTNGETLMVKEVLFDDSTELPWERVARHLWKRSNLCRR